MLCALHVIHTYVQIYTYRHTPGIHVRGRSGSLLPPWVASLGSEDRDRPACTMRTIAMLRCIDRAHRHVRIQVGSKIFLSFLSFFRLRPFPVKGIHYFFIKTCTSSFSHLGERERERDISILRKLTRKLNRSNFPSPREYSSSRSRFGRIRSNRPDSRGVEDLYPRSAER